MAGKQSVHEPNFVNKKKAERHADQPGSNAQSPIEPRESFVCVGKRQHHRSGDEHHPSNRANPKHEEIGNRPFRIANRRQHQQRDRSRAGEAMDKSHDERPHDLIETEPAEMAIEPAQRCLLWCVWMSFGVVLVRMSMNVISMAMWVRMSEPRYSAGRRERVGNPLEHAGQVKDAQKNQHQADGKFHRETDARWNDPAEQNNSAAHQQDRKRVAHAPNGANQRGVADLSVSRDDGCNGDDVVRVGGVPHSEEEAERDDGEQTDHFLVVSV
jgi:hypothetical protein